MDSHFRRASRECGMDQRLYLPMDIGLFAAVARAPSLHHLLWGCAVLPLSPPLELCGTSSFVLIYFFGLERLAPLDCVLFGCFDRSFTEYHRYMVATSVRKIFTSRRRAGCSSTSPLSESCFFFCILCCSDVGFNVLTDTVLDWCLSSYFHGPDRSGSTQLVVHPGRPLLFLVGYSGELHFREVPYRSCWFVFTESASSSMTARLKQS